jgi:selenocysteine-specific elongation factor
LYEEKQLKPGADAFAQLRLSAPLCLVRGDRFIIRQFSPVLTMGGGVVLDAMPPRKGPLAARLEFLKIQAEGDPGPALLARIARRGSQGIPLAQLVAEIGQGTDRIENWLSEFVGQGVVARRADLLMERGALNDVAARLHQLVTEFHHRNPLVAGVSKESLREQARVSAEVFELALAQDAANVGIRFEKTGKGTASSRALPRVGAPGDSSASSKGLAEKKLEIAGELVRLPGGGVVMRDEETESKKIIEQAFAEAGLKVPALKDVLAGLKIDKARAQKITTLLLRERILIKVSEELVFHHTALADLRKSLVAQQQLSPHLDVARFKELTGVSRKYAIPLLEYLDRERVTRRVGEARVIL